MSPQTIQEIASRISAMLDEYGIDYQRFGMSIVASPQYYESIKEHFPDRPAFDLGFTQMRVRDSAISAYEPHDNHGWSITLVSGLSSPIPPEEGRKDVSQLG